MRMLGWVFLLSVASVVEAAGALLTITVAGVIKNDGPVRVALYASESEYQQDIEPAIAAILVPDAETVEWTVQEIPPGVYAVAAYQDRNENGHLDKWFFGRPKERYGFSKSPSRLRRPVFSEISFSLDGARDHAVGVEIH